MDDLTGHGSELKLPNADHCGKSLWPQRPDETISYGVDSWDSTYIPGKREVCLISQRVLKDEKCIGRQVRVGSAVSTGLRK